MVKSKLRFQNCQTYDMGFKNYVMKIYRFFLYDDRGEIYAKLRVDVTPVYVGIHPYVWTFTPSIVKRIEQDVIECTTPILKIHNRKPEVYLTTHDNRIPRLVSKRFEHVKDNIDETGFNLWVWRM